MKSKRFRRIKLVDTGTEISPLPGGVMLSTKPRVAVSTPPDRFVIKGDSVETVVAESLGYALAELADIPIPEWGLAKVRGSSHLWFASQLLEVRQTEAFLRSKRYSNTDFLGKLIVFDQWIGNADRNVNNIVARIPVEGERGEPELVAIDFEKAYVLRGESQLLTFARSPAEFLPRHFLRNLLDRDQQFDMSEVQRIESITRDQIEWVFQRFNQLEDGFFPELPIPWAANGISHLASRARRIRALMQEAFNV